MWLILQNVIVFLPYAYGRTLTGKLRRNLSNGLWTLVNLLILTCLEITALTSRVTTFDDDLTPVVEEKETPESLDEVTTATLQRQRSNGDDEHMDVKMSSSDSNPDSDRYQGSSSYPFC